MKKIILALLGSSLLVLGAQAAQSVKPTKAATAQPVAAETQAEKDKAVIAQQAPSYPLDTCVISGEKFSEESPAVDMVVDGRLVRVCCKRCVTKVNADSAPSIEKINAAVIRAQKSSWPLTTCPVSGEGFGGDMGEPIDYVVGTRYVKLCCKGCIKPAKKDPVAFLAKLDEKLMPALAKTYPLKTCVVSGEELGSMGDPIDMMYGHRLVRLCCKGCVRKYKKDPAALVAKIYAAPAKKAAK